MDQSKFIVINRHELSDQVEHVVDAMTHAFALNKPDGFFIESDHPDFDAVQKLLLEKEQERIKANKCYSCGESLNYASPANCQNDEHIPF